MAETFTALFKTILPAREDFFGEVPEGAELSDDFVIVVPLTIGQIRTIYDLMEAENDNDN